MTVTAKKLLDAALRLHDYLLKTHWSGQALVGPDPGIRWNARLGRFVKSYLSFVPWSDNYTYLQAQAYWVFNNWLMADLLADEAYKTIAQDCSTYILEIQKPEGYWEYPNPEWRDRVATVEGGFATLGLLESYAHTDHEPFLVGAKLWCRYMLDEVGFQGENGRLAVNYFANLDAGMVPNNSTIALQMLAKLAHVTNDEQFLATCPGMVTWLNEVQLESGELPYAAPRATDEGRPHFLCYQYNAFEFLDLVEYHQLTQDAAIWPLLERLAGYLSHGLTEVGAARYDCFQATPELPYYTLAVGQALSQATQLRFGDYQPLVDQAYERVLSQQQADGRFDFHSRFNYRFLSDRRSYPRYLAMILNHLLREYQTRTKTTVSSHEGA